MGVSISSEYTPKYNLKNYNKQCPGQNVYKIDDNSVYWRGERVNEANGGTFTDYGNGYGKDNMNVFFQGFIITTIGSFKVLKDKYAIDSVNVYYRGKPIIDSDRKTFKVTTDGMAIDKKYKYTYGKKTGMKRQYRSRTNI
jgi:hypothetical protein